MAAGPDVKSARRPIMPINENPLLHGSVKRRLFINILHTMTGLLAVVSFNVVDTWFISRLGVEALSVMGYVTPVVLMSIAVLVGAEMASSVNIAESVAKDDYQCSNRTVLACLSFSQVVSWPMVILANTTGEWMLGLLGADEDIIALGIDYFEVWFLGFPFLAICMIGGGLLRGEGDSKGAARLLMMSTVINLLLDPILIFGVFSWPGLGMVGAAWASFIAKSVCALLIIVTLMQKFNIGRLLTLPLAEHFKFWLKLSELAATVAFNRLLVPFGTAVATTLVATHGHLVVAAFGLTNTLLALPTAFVLAVNGALVPFIRQNLSVELTDRAVRAILFCLWLIVFWGSAQALVFWLFQSWIITSFTTDAKVIELLTFCFTWVPMSLTGVGLFLVNNALCYSMKNNRQVLLLNLERCFLIYLPCVWIGGEHLGQQGVFIGLAVANAVMGLIATVRIRLNLNTLLKSR